MSTPLTSPEVQPSAEIPVVKVLYLFAGRRRHSDVGAFLKQAESNGKIKLILKEFDIERSPMHDLTDVSLWSEIFDTLNEGGWCVIVSPPSIHFHVPGSNIFCIQVQNHCGQEHGPKVFHGCQMQTKS